jgi:hypothetical protein
VTISRLTTQLAAAVNKSICGLPRCGGFPSLLTICSTIFGWHFIFFLPFSLPSPKAGAFGETSIVNLGDFDIVSEQPLAGGFAEAFKGNAASITPYCFDHIRRRVIFTVCDAKAGDLK